jgi:ABC-type transport system involved in cytochrome c biogenesis permease subunit
MKPYRCLILGLALTLAGGRAAPAADKPPALGVGAAYETLARLPVMHAGRVKPIDTLAREEVKQIYGGETIKLRNDENEVVATWGPVAALYDWSVRPSFWDDQPIILVAYLPLKRLILADSIETTLAAVAGHDSTAAADREDLKKLAASAELSAADLIRFAQRAKLSDADRTTLRALAAKLSEEHKWLSPAELEEAQVSVDGQRKPFETWFRDAHQKKQAADQDPTSKDRPSEVEKRAIEVGTRLVHYQALSKREVRSVEPLLMMPRPSNPAYLAFIAGIAKKVHARSDLANLSLLELDSFKALDTFFNDTPVAERAIPGANSKFDARFSAWLRTSSTWIPLRALLDAKPEQLVEAGFPSKETEAFLAAFKALDEAEGARPGQVDEAKAKAMVTAARALGEAVSPESYPTVAAIDREAYFNAFNPFVWAPGGYLAALALLAVSLGFSTQRGRPQTAVGWLGRGLYAAGMAGLISGIALEVLGFRLRVLISGWAPVTNMYETVIWVSLVAAVLGLVLELIYRRVFSALAASGVALLGTVLAANVPLLDPGIRALQPVLRSNYWLTIHVLTEVSSYAAFALAMGLGLIATLYYLTATYRRSPGWLELAVPLVVGLPLLVGGALGLDLSGGAFGVRLSPSASSTLYWAAGTLAFVGGSLTIVGGGALLGEMVSRLTFHDTEALDEAALAGAVEEPAATAVQTVTVGEANGPVATLTRPSVAEMRAMAARHRPKLDARGLAMQVTAAQIKPLANFIYRAMQVGVLLIAAGTALGGFWADVSWGRFWGWDPKEVWALITLLVYLIPLHGRFAGWVNTFGLVMASVICFLSVVMAWYGVNFVLGVGLHSYGFVEGGSQGIVGAVVVAVLSVAGAAAWRRSLGSRVRTA